MRAVAMREHRADWMEGIDMICDERRCSSFVMRASSELIQDQDDTFPKRFRKSFRTSSLSPQPSWSTVCIWRLWTTHPSFSAVAKPSFAQPPQCSVSHLIARSVWGYEGFSDAEVLLLRWISWRESNKCDQRDGVADRNKAVDGGEDGARRKLSPNSPL